MRKFEFYGNRVQEFFENADKRFEVKFNYILDFLSDEKNGLKEPYVRHIYDSGISNIFEIRIKVSEKMVRVIFYAEDNNIFLLHAFYKKDMKTTKREIKTAIKIYEEMLTKTA